MRRLLVPGLLLLAALVAGAATLIADRASDAGTATATETVSTAATPVLSPRRVPALLVEPSADAALGEVLTDIAARSPEGSCLVVNRNAKTIFAHNPERWMVPASTQKIITAAAALDRLGADHTFTTEARATAPIGGEGVLAGDLWLVGGGDPVISTAPYRARFPTARPATELEQLADDLVSAGLREIGGRVVGDEARYDQQRTVASWDDNLVAINRAGPLSALMVNDGFTSFPGDSPDNDSVTPSSDPPAHAASLLTELLEERGVVTNGDPGSGSVPDQTQVVASIDSPPLGEILLQMNTYSDNTTAELLVKEIAVVAGRPGSTADGVGVVSQAVGDLGAATVSAADGSGLSRDNITTCATLTALLDQEGAEGPLVDSLAIGGETGTLAGRFLDQSTRGRIVAKSGSLAGVDALAGVARTRSDQRLTFAYLVNGSLLDPTVVPRLLEELAVALVGWPEGPAITDVAPGP